MSLNVVDGVEILPVPSLLVQSQSETSTEVPYCPFRFLSLPLVNASAGLWP